jgi:YVTN family beta-propeller protein
MTAKALSLILSSFLCATHALAQSTPSPALLALSKHDRTLAIVDPVTLKIVARMPSGPDPHEVIASSDGKLAYISNYGGGAYNTITVVDLAAQMTVRMIDLGALRGPHGLDYAGGKLFFTAETSKVIGSYDPASQKVDWVMGTGQDRTHMVLVSNDLNWIATSNVSSATISILEKSKGGGPGGPPPGPPPGAGNGPGGPPPGMPPPGGPRGGMPVVNWVQTVIPVGRGDEGFDVSPDRKELWSANAQDGTVSVIEIASKKVVATLNANVGGANRLKFTPDGKLVFISSLRGGDLVILDAATRTETKRVPIGRGAAGIQMQPDGARAFVACSPDNYIAVIDLKTLTVSGHLDVGGEPDGMAWAVRP